MCREDLEKEPMKTKSIACRFALCSVTFSILAAAFLVLVTGCGTTKTHYNQSPPSSMQSSNDVVLREADGLKIAYPGNDQLDTEVSIRRDGKITLPTIGEVVAAGKTPSQLQKELVLLYSKDLVNAKDITVIVVSSTFPVYVNGAVLSPGKLNSNHPLTVLEAIMESGGFDYTRANLKAIKVVRTKDGKTQTYTINLKGIISGGPIDIFYLEPSDIVYVPAKIVLF